MIEDNAFSSDRYVINSQLELHGLDESSLILISDYFSLPAPSSFQRI